MSNLSRWEERFQYYVASVGAIASLIVGIASLLLGIVVFSTDTKVAQMDKVVDQLIVQGKRQDDLLETQHQQLSQLTSQTSKQDSMIQDLKSLIEVSTQQSSKLGDQIKSQNEILGIESKSYISLAKQLQISEDQKRFSLEDRRMELKSDSIQLANAYDSIALLRQRLLPARQQYEYDLFRYLGYPATMNYLESVKKIIDGQMTNKFLFARDSIFIQWRNMRTWIQNFIVYCEIAPDDPGEAGHFRSYKEFHNAMQVSFHNYYEDFVLLNNKVFNRSYISVSTGPRNQPRPTQ